MIRNLLILAFLCILPMDMTAQLRVGHRIDSVKVAEYREKIGLDYSMPDYSVTSIDEGKMGSWLANLLRFYEDVKNHGSYSLWLDTILGEQIEELEHVYPEVKKQKLVRAYKSGNEITIIYKLWLGKNPANIKQTEIKYHFKDGVSESYTVNEMFSQMSHYVHAREQLNK